MKIKVKDVIRNINDEGLAKFLTAMTLPSDTPVDSTLFESNVKTMKKYLDEEIYISEEDFKKYIVQTWLRNNDFFIENRI